MLLMLVYKYLKEILNTISSQLIDYSIHVLTWKPWIISQCEGMVDDVWCRMAT